MASTGGAGFSKDSNNRLRDNHNLGKIRGETTFSKSIGNPDSRNKAETKSINDAIDHRFTQKNRMKSLAWISIIGLVIVILAFLLF